MACLIFVSNIWEQSWQQWYNVDLTCADVTCVLHVGFDHLKKIFKPGSIYWSNRFIGSRLILIALKGSLYQFILQYDKLSHS